MTIIAKLVSFASAILLITALSSGADQTTTTGVLDRDSKGELELKINGSRSNIVPIDERGLSNGVPVGAIISAQVTPVDAKSGKASITGVHFPLSEKLKALGDITTGNGKSFDFKRQADDVSNLYSNVSLVDSAGITSTEVGEKITKASIGLNNDAILDQAGNAFASQDVRASDGAKLIDLARIALLSNKAIYGADDEFAPYIYKTIVERSHGCIALWNESDGRYVGSGFLIGDDLLLTAKHVTDENRPSDLRCHFDYDKESPRITKPIIEFAIQHQPMIEDETCDFSIFQIVVPLNSTKLSARWPSQPLSTQDVQRNTRVYVIGFPLGRQMTVADNAKVVFPFHMNDTELNRLRLEINAEWSNDRKHEMLNEFDQSYVKMPTGLWENHSPVAKRHPTIGIDSDTFTGNSGSPVFSKVEGKVIGILSGGRISEPNQALVVSPEDFEAIVPMSEIVKKMKASGLPWENHGVVFTDN